MEKIKQTIKELFKRIGINDIKIDIKKDNSTKDRELLMINVLTEQADFLLKDEALELNALQHILRLLVLRTTPDHNFIILDINNYKEKRQKLLEKLAEKIIKDIRKTKKSIVLDPMPAYERRIIHLKLAEQPDIVSESTGQEPERKIVVRPYP
ncbi:hypothetical protein KKA23_02045 [Patescibacteria group bacterium]|nr:hypothetical protein [Patescibacteria group bacterium]